MPRTHPLKVSSVPVMLALLALGLAGCEPAQPLAAPPPAPAVTVAKPTKRLVAEQDEYVGRFVAVDAIEIRARVSGYLDAIHFKDGQLVKKGDLLFTIDRRPFEATLARRRRTWHRPAPTSPTRRPTWSADRASCAAAPSRSRPSTSARRPSGWRKPRWPRRRRRCARRPRPRVHGAAGAGLGPHRRPPRVGRQPRHGGYDRTTTLLATITSIDPIRFEFTMDEASYLRYMRVAGDNAAATNRGIDTAVILKLIDEPKFSHVGKMDFVDNAIDRSSGTIRGRAEFPTPAGRDAWNVRAHPGAGRSAEPNGDGTRGRHRHRAGAQVRAGCRRRQRRAAEVCRVDQRRTVDREARRREASTFPRHHWTGLEILICNVRLAKQWPSHLRNGHLIENLQHDYVYRARSAKQLTCNLAATGKPLVGPFLCLANSRSASPARGLSRS